MGRVRDLLDTKARLPDTSRQVVFLALLVLPWVTPFFAGPSVAFWPWLTGWVCLLLLILVGRALPHQLVWCAWLIAGIASAAIGLMQYFGVNEGNPLFNQAPWGEAYGNLRQRNLFATLCNIALVALHGLCLGRGTAESRSKLVWVGTGFALVLLAFANAASASRTGLLQLTGLFAATLLLPAWRRRSSLGFYGVVLVAYAGGMILLPWLAGMDPFAHGMLARVAKGEAVCSSRLTLWSNVLHLMAQRPWAGWGWGELDYAHYITLYDGPRFCDILDNAHNLPLHLAVELGGPAAAVAIVGIGAVVKRGRPWREQDVGRQTAWAVISLVALHSLLEYPLWYSPFQLAMGLCVLTLWPCRVPMLAAGSWWRTAVRCISMSLLVMLAYAAWDYHRISQIYLPAEARSLAYRDNTLAKIQDSWLFRDQVRFAELTLTSVTRENAAHMEALALDLLHFSPEPRVIEKLIEAAVLLGHEDLAKFHMVRFRAAFPDAYAKWLLSGAQTPAT